MKQLLSASNWMRSSDFKKMQMHASNPFGQYHLVSLANIAGHWGRYQNSTPGRGNNTSSAFVDFSQVWTYLYMGANMANRTQSTDPANPISERSDTIITCHKMKKLQSASNQMLVQDKQSGLERHTMREGIKRYGSTLACSKRCL